MRNPINLQRRQLATAVGAALMPMLAATTAQAQLEEVVVTATKQEASLQDVAVAVSALTEESLNQRGITNFSDYLIELPNVTAGGAGPGQSTMYIRGVASTTPNLTTSGVAGLSPNVAMYLDEQPLSQPGRNLDVYIVDMNRVEVLAGPQGTLFGASSQAGVVRLITNKPDTTEFSGNIKAGTSWMKDGEMNYNVNGTINVPITDNFAIRASIYADQKGGYIDNVAGTRSVSESARFRPGSTKRSNGTEVGFRGGFQAGADLSNVNFIDADNSALVEDDFNDTRYTGGRISALWNVNDDWSVRVGAMVQEIDSDGTFYADPNLGDDYKIQRFEAENIKDEYTSLNWTVEGRLGALDVIYTGAFTERETDQRVDYSDYLFIGQYIPYYICDYYVSYTSFAPGGVPTGNCYSPNLYTTNKVDSEFQTHELRFSTDQSARVRVTAGAFYSDMELTEQVDFSYPSNQLVDAWGAGSGNGFGFAPNSNYPYDGQGGYRPGEGPYPADTIFRNDILRTDEQMGFFGEVSYDLSDSLTVTGGLRYYDYEVDLAGSANSSFYNMSGSDYNKFGTNINDLYDGDQSIRWTYSGFFPYEASPVYTPNNLPDPSDPNYQRIVNSIYAPDVAEDDGVIGKVTLAWAPNDDSMYYVTWSEGFRTGVLNRPGGAVQKDTGYTVPFDVASDELTNLEVGWKLDMMDGTLRFNGALFLVDITDLQTTIFDTSIVNLFFSDNAADADVKGVEGDITWLASDNLTIGGAFSLLDTEVTSNNTTSTDVIVGSELAYAPNYQGNLWARYEWNIGDGWVGHFMPSVAFSDSSYSDIISINSMEIPSWTKVNLTAGITADRWMVEAFVDNLTDEQVITGANYVNDRERLALAPPTTAGIRVSMDF
ncbi:MAG: TonB-dependent receptor [Halieaceae bacterium]|jgi:iron complex outermembrane receptor protein|nr:TonB-dependent receptor [marine gamma proteobacterium HTCC2080]MBT3460017.1 TonB-dependent receptor [Halieaceae bacterium]